MIRSLVLFIPSDLYYSTNIGRLLFGYNGCGVYSLLHTY